MTERGQGHSLDALATSLATMEDEHLLFSPTSTATGATGSSEAIGSASRSLIASVSRRHDSNTVNSRISMSTNQRVDSAGAIKVVANTSGNVASELDTTTMRDESPVQDLVLPGRSSDSTDSWDNVSPFVPPPLPIKREYIEDQEEGERDYELDSTQRRATGAIGEYDDNDDDDDDDNNNNNNNEIENDDFDEEVDEDNDDYLQDGVDRLPHTRSLRRISQWLRETIPVSMSDATSSVTSDDAFSSVADATRRATLGLRAPAFVEERRCNPSSMPVDPRNPSLDSTVHDELMRSPTESGGGESRLDSDVVDVKIEIEENDVKPTLPQKQATMKEIAIQAECISLTFSRSSSSSSSSSYSSKVDMSPVRQWQIVAFLLGLSLAVVLLQPRLSSVTFSRQPSTRTNHENLDIAPGVSIIYNLGNNSTRVVDHPTAHMNLGRSMPPTALSSVFATLVITVTALVLKKKKMSDSRGSRSHAATSNVPLDPTSILSARELVAEGARRYGLGHTVQAASLFERALKLRCSLADKAIASEWQGRSLYRLARAQASDRLMNQAVVAFRQAARLDKSSATARASLGRALFAVGKYEEAVFMIETALARDDKLSIAYEYLGKAKTKLGDWSAAERHLFRAIKLDSNSYTARAFLGERLHQLGRNKEAKRLLSEAIAIRSDYPAAHARLAFIATESRDNETACKHLRAAIAWRETGCIDDNLSLTAESIQGPSPYFALYFALSDTKERVEVLRQASKVYPHDQLLSILLSTNLRRSSCRTERNKALVDLKLLDQTLVNRIRRFRNDLPARGLYVLVLVGTGKLKEAESQHQVFWNRLAAERSVAKTIPFTLLALVEARKLVKF